MGDIDRIDLAQHKDTWRIFVAALINLLFALNAENFLSIWVTISFSGTAVLRWVSYIQTSDNTLFIPCVLNQYTVHDTGKRTFTYITEWVVYDKVSFFVLCTINVAKPSIDITLV